MSNVTKILMLAAAVLITVGVITVGLVIYNQGKAAVDISSKGMDNIQKNLQDANWQAYDTTTVSGSQVINAIRMYAETGQITVSVKTSMAAAAVTYDGTHKYGVTDPSNTNYINPVGNFSSVLTRNSNGIVSTIAFTQS